MAGMRHTSKHKHTKQTGFTVIEVVVVMLILAVIAGTVVTAFGPNFVDEQEDRAVRFEMTQIRDATLQFIQDNPSHNLADANLCTPADASFLFNQEFDSDNDCIFGEEIGPPDPDIFDNWDPDYRLGWQGPYITRLSNRTADIDTDILFTGNETTPGVPGVIQNNVPVLMDPYNNPYYFFDLDDNVLARIVSTGADGVYDSFTNATIAGQECVPNNDDIVVCLR